MTKVFTTYPIHWSKIMNSQVLDGRYPVPIRVLPENLLTFPIKACTFFMKSLKECLASPAAMCVKNTQDAYSKSLKVIS